MASSRDTSNGPDWQDCQVVMREMQSAMEARVELTIRPSAGEEKPSMVIKATAYPYLSAFPAARQSVSLSVRCPSSSGAMVAAATFRLLLALDYEVSKAWATRVAT